VLPWIFQNVPRISMRDYTEFATSHGTPHDRAFGRYEVGLQVCGVRSSYRGEGGHRINPPCSSGSCNSCTGRPCRIYSRQRFAQDASSNSKPQFAHRFSTTMNVSRPHSGQFSSGGSPLSFTATCASHARLSSIAASTMSSGSAPTPHFEQISTISGAPLALALALRSNDDEQCGHRNSMKAAAKPRFPNRRCRSLRGRHPARL
jgi:hypothetical protein